jgi:epoxyqueuosine reductase
VLSSLDVIDRARAVGFHLAGLAPVARLDAVPLQAWLSAGMHAQMAWMARKIEERLDPREILTGAGAVLALACCVRSTTSREDSPIATYARGRDYHATMRDRLRALGQWLRPRGVHWYAEVDTGPVLEKVWAERAGLGWIGKNGLLIAPPHGSQVVLATLFLNSEVDRYDTMQRRQCGTCVACLEACPTGALVAPGVVDARRCLSYQTIENRGEYDEKLRTHARLAFGCEECQRVCPWNLPDHSCDDPRFTPRPISRLSLSELALLSPEQFEVLARGTAVARARYHGLRRNAAIALGARRDPETGKIRPLLDDPEPTVRSAAEWALAR